MKSILITVFFILVMTCTLSSCFQTVHKNCSSLRDGDRYWIRTEVELNRNLQSCDQEWIRERQNISEPLGYLQTQENTLTIIPPILLLTSKEMFLESCINLTLMLHCSQVENITFLVYLDTEIEMNLTDLKMVIVPIVVVAVAGVLLLKHQYLYNSAKGQWFRSCSVAQNEQPCI